MDTQFRTRYRRPAKFSNPYRHFPQQDLNRIIRTGDGQLTWSDFSRIFHWGTPAGSYEEVVYFLPLALRHIELNPRDALEFMSGILCFIESNAKRLESDSLHRKTENAIEKIFQTWTAQFVVVHYDANACREKGWVLDHDDIVQNCQSVMELIEDLQAFPVFPKLPDKLLQSIALQQNDPIRSAWFLECACAMQDWRGGNIKRTETLSRLITDHDLLQDHYNRIVKTIVISTDSPTYWADIRTALGLR